MANSITYRWIFFILLCGVMSPLLAQEAGKAVRIQGVITEDVYVAGATVDVHATIEGDVVVAGGRVTVGERVTGDVMAAGGMVSVRANIADDVRLAGGDITLSGIVGDDAIAAGGSIVLMPESDIKGRAWFSGGSIDMAGTVGKELRAAGGRIVLSGRVKGDVELVGRDISILDSAVIEGDLVYRSPREVEIASGAQIRGAISYEPVERPVAAAVWTVAGVGMVFLASLIITGIALYLMFPRFIGTAVATVRAKPLKCFALGLAVFAATPVIIGMLFFTVIGWLPAIVITSLYLILLLAGFLTGTFYVGELGLGLLGRGEVTRYRRLGSFVVAMILLMLLGLVPLLGQLLLFSLMLLGTGVLKLSMYKAYVGDSRN